MRLKNLTTLRGKAFLLAKKNSTPHFLKNVIVLITPNNLNIKRFGLIVSKKVGNAIVRNFVKRRLRVILVALNELLSQGFDFIFIGRASAAHSKFISIFNEITELIKGHASKIASSHS